MIGKNGCAKILWQCDLSIRGRASFALRGCGMRYESAPHDQTRNDCTQAPIQALRMRRTRPSDAANAQISKRIRHARPTRRRRNLFRRRKLSLAQDMRTCRWAQSTGINP
jgi:hypothetical protein